MKNFEELIPERPLYTPEEMNLLDCFEEFTGPAKNIVLRKGEWFDKQGQELVLLTGGRVKPDDSFQIGGQDGQYICKGQPIKIVKFGVLKPKYKSE